MGIPFQRDVVEDVLQRMRISKVGDATIRQTVALSEELERRTGEKFIHLEMGSPGLPASRFGIEAQKEALDNGVASSYPNISGIAPLKEQASRFVKAFLDIDVKPEGCIPTVGSMMVCFFHCMYAPVVGKRHDIVYQSRFLRTTFASKSAGV